MDIQIFIRRMLHLWVQDANFNDLDFANGTDPADVELTLRYDYAILQF